MNIDQTTPYDAMIAAAMRRHLGAWDWRWLKAQIFQESKFNPNAVSRVGAKGLPQFMDPTWDDMLVNVPGIPKTATPFDPYWSIEAAAWYMAKLRSIWRADRSEDDRRRLAQASYNAGIGNVMRAQNRAGGAIGYADIIARLHEVTGEANAAETRGYVENIQRWYDQLLSYDGDDHASR